MFSLRMLRPVVLAVAWMVSPFWAGTAQAHGVTLRVHHHLPVESAFHTRFLLPWLDKLEQESHGYLRFQVFPATPANGNPLQLIDQVKDRAADIVWTSVGDDTKRFPAFAVFSLPFRLHSAKGANRALWEYVQMHNLAKKEFAGLRLLAVHLSVAGSSGSMEIAGKGDPEPPSRPKQFILAMNAEAYKSLSDETKKIIHANSGAEMSALLGRTLVDDVADAGRPTNSATTASPAQGTD